MVTVPADGAHTSVRKKMDPITMVVFILACLLFVALTVRTRLERIDATRPPHAQRRSPIASYVSRSQSFTVTKQRWTWSAPTRLTSSART